MKESEKEVVRRTCGRGTGGCALEFERERMNMTINGKKQSEAVFGLEEELLCQDATPCPRDICECLQAHCWLRREALVVQISPCHRKHARSLGECAVLALRRAG